LFYAYFTLGLTHILDLQGYDHMLFLLLLIAGINVNRWKQLFALITAFTLGHSITLAIATIYQPVLPSKLVEFLIPITIMLTGIYNLTAKESNIKLKLSITTSFGLIHGMGFASYLSSLLPKESSIWQPLLSFNLRVETGQFVFSGIIIAFILLAQFTLKNAIHRTQNIISVVGVVISIFLAASNWPYL
jgi:hydrogenase/urease accessory protein HupE